MVLQPLKEALTLVYWYKRDLRAFLHTVIENRELVAHLDWSAYKRTIVSQLVDTLARQQSQYFDDLLNLLLATADITDPAHLRRVDDGDAKYDEAVDALRVLQKQVAPYKSLRNEEEEAERRRKAKKATAELQQAMTERIAKLQSLFLELVRLDPQARGYKLEQLLNGLFAAFDLDVKSPFRIYGEQIDGAFTFNGTEYLLEVKWQAAKTPAADLDAFSMKIARKLDNTLGLFVSINGFQQSAVDLHSQGRPTMILMDGSDLSAVLENRMTLPELLTRKKQHAAHTGEIYRSAYQILGSSDED